MFDEQDPPAPKRRGRRVEQTPVQRALGLLVRREHSRNELTRKLTARGIEREDAEAAVDKLSEAGWQDEARFAHSMVRNRAAAGYGPLHIRAELGTHRLPDELVRQAMDDYDGDWADNARDLVRRRFPTGWMIRPGGARPPTCWHAAVLVGSWWASCCTARGRTGTIRPDTLEG